MPLIKSPSKKAFEKNVKTEMGANPGKDKRAQNLAIAYSVQRQSKKKKMALGGAVESPDYSKHPYDRNPGTPEPKPDNKRLDPKDYMSEQWAGGPDPIRKPDDKRLPMAEYMSDEMGGKFAEGGFVDSEGDKITADSITPEELRMIGDYRRKMALGGAVESPDYSKHPFDQEPAMPMAKKDDERLPEDEYMSDKMGGEFAEGGMIDHIRMKMKMKKMADGGMVDLLEEGSKSQTPMYPERNSAILKENYDDKIVKMSQPEDSNEHGDSLEEDDERGETHEDKKRGTVDKIMQRRMRGK